MKRFIMAVAVTCALGFSAYAGDMPTGGTPSPSIQTTETGSSTLPGDTPSIGKSELSSDALNAVLSVLSFVAF